MPPTTNRPTPPTEAHQAIARLAHQYWQARQKTHQPGTALEDWLRAESDYLQAREAAIDESSEESFPASDPPAR